MKFAILSLVAAAGLTLSAGSALAGPPGHYHGGYGGYRGYSFHPVGPHLDYHRGHYHYHDGFYRSPPVVPVYPSYSYPSYGYGYNSGFGLTVTRPGFNFSVGNGYAVPYGGGYYGRRW
jgi:hypothetical protein